jgi:hypothetical protein
VTDDILTLKEPLELRSAKTGEVINTIATLTLRKPKLGDLVAAMDAAGGTKEPGTMTLHLASRITGMPVRDLAELGLEDGAALLERVAGFMPAGLTGGKSS